MAATIPNQVREALRVVADDACQRGCRDVAVECYRFAQMIDDQAATKLRALLR